MNLENQNETKEKIEVKEKGIKGFYHRHKILIWEIFRFLLVGGLATLVDWSLSFVLEIIFPEMVVASWHVEKTLASAIGFTIGLLINYFLSVIFVYKNKKDEKEGKTVKDFLIFTLISLTVLLVQLVGIFILSDLLKFYFIVAKIIMTAIGLVINYLGRKIFIFK